MKYWYELKEMILKQKNKKKTLTYIFWVLLPIVNIILLKNILGNFAKSLILYYLKKITIAAAY